jgi:hypothetical protein
MAITKAIRTEFANPGESTRFIFVAPPLDLMGEKESSPKELRFDHHRRAPRHHDSKAEFG